MSYETMRERFARNLKDSMFDQDISQSMLEERTGISQRTIRRYLNCETSPTLDELELIANGVNKNIFALLVS